MSQATVESSLNCLLREDDELQIVRIDVTSGSKYRVKYASQTVWCFGNTLLEALETLRKDELAECRSVEKLRLEELKKIQRRIAGLGKI